MTILGKRGSVQDESDDELAVKPSQVKKRRIIDSDEDSENTDSNLIKDPKTKSAVKRPLVAEKPATPKVAKKAATEKEEDIESVGGKDSLLKVDLLNKVWSHETLPFLQPNAIRDKDMRKPTDPNYDPRTIHVPQDFIMKQTPGKSLLPHL